RRFYGEAASVGLSSISRGPGSAEGAERAGDLGSAGRCRVVHPRARRDARGGVGRWVEDPAELGAETEGDGELGDQEERTYEQAHQVVEEGGLSSFEDVPHELDRPPDDEGPEPESEPQGGAL